MKIFSLSRWFGNSADARKAKELAKLPLVAIGGVLYKQVMESKRGIKVGEFWINKKLVPEKSKSSVLCHCALFMGVVKMTDSKLIENIGFIPTMHAITQNGMTIFMAPCENQDM